MDEINLAVVSDLVDTVGLLLAACVLKLGNRHKKLITCSVVYTLFCLHQCIGAPLQQVSVGVYCLVFFGILPC